MAGGRRQSAILVVVRRWDHGQCQCFQLAMLASILLCLPTMRAKALLGVIRLPALSCLPSRSVRFRPAANEIKLLVTIISLVTAAPVFADGATTPSPPAPAVSEPPAIAADFRPTVGVGLAGTIVGSLGSFQSGAAIMARVAWGPTPSLRVTAAVERLVARMGEVLCDCAVLRCCVGANAPYTWLGLGVEGHATPRSRVDVYAGAELGTVLRNAWRFAAKGEIGLDLRLAMFAVGPFAGLMTASPDSLFNENANYAFTFGLRAMVVAGVRPARP